MKFNRVLICSIVVLLLIIPFSESFSQSYGRISALKKRAVTVTQQKNHFLTRVLDSYSIPYECSEKGVVVRMKIDNTWKNIKRIEIVPIISDDERGLQVTAHNIFFDTDRGTFHLVSQLIIR